jgi:outer membrane lipoprotein-sorting protein
MRKIIILLLIICATSTDIFGQKQYTSIKDSDAEAIKLMNSAKSLLQKSSSVVLEYRLTIQEPETKPSIINGIAKQKGIKYYIESGDKYFYCDGKSLVVWNRTQNIAQINNVDSKSGTLTPEGLLKEYDEKKYIFVLSDVKTTKTKKLQKIVLKPVNKRSEYSKIEINIDTKTKLPDEIKMFMKNGNKSFLKINSVKLNQKIDNNVFTFNKTEHRGVTVDDLRMD